MNNKDKLMIIIILLAFFVCIGVGSYSYSKYINRNNSEIKGKIARWYITLNGKNINGTEKAEIEVIQENNEHIANGVIAPTSQAYFELQIDATATDVSLQYQIKIEPTENSVIKDFSIYKMVDLDTNDETLAADGTISGTMAANDTNKTINKKIYIKWDDDPDTEQMDDEADTKAAAAKEIIDDEGNKQIIYNYGTVNVTVSFTQIPEN
ncbi:MAG: hypothetical protein ACI4WW_07915 [Candidatus Coprovivens sp.]